MSMESELCLNATKVESGDPIISSVTFSTGVVGNIVALVLVVIRRRGTGASLYQVLITALLMNDVLGSVCLSPLVLFAYARSTALLGMSENRELCSYFGFTMTLLSLAALAMLCVMALERYLSIGQPYFYERHLCKRHGYLAIGLIYLGSILFCVAPFVGFGEYVQYCPGTWCFLEMRSTSKNSHKVFMGFYASFILIMTSSTVLCNIYVIFILAMMYRRHKARGVSAHSRYHRSLSMTEEMEHLLPLAITTVVFIFCTFPLVFRVCLNLTSSNGKQTHDLGALRLLSFHSILNPWVFIILRPSVLKVIWRKLYKPQKSTCFSGNTVSVQSSQSQGRTCCASSETGM